ALEEQLHRADETLTRRTADFEQQQTEDRLAEEQLRKAKELNSELRKNLSFFEEANKTFDLTRQDLHARLEASLTAGQEAGAKLQREGAERQRLADSLEAVQRQLENQSRKRQTLDAARAARALRNSMRRQIREPVYNLCQSARSLLELELGEPQKKLAEAVLQDALLVHTSLQEAEIPPGDSTESAPTAEKVVCEN